MTPLRTTVFSILAAGLIGGIALVPLLTRTRLGPKETLDLPPTDLDRVHAGVVAPDFSLRALSGDVVTLSDYRGRRNVVLVFYRGHW